MSPSGLFQFHQDNLASLPEDLREGMIACLQPFLGPQDNIEAWHKLMTAKPHDWWHGYHMGMGMGVRNRLRADGFDDGRVGRNLDDVWVPLFEEAVKRSFDGNTFYTKIHP